MFLAGLAFDFCVRHSAEDARREGFEAFVLEDASRGIDIDGSVAAAHASLAALGVPHGGGFPSPGTEPKGNVDNRTAGLNDRPAELSHVQPKQPIPQRNRKSVQRTIFFIPPKSGE